MVSGWWNFGPVYIHTHRTALDEAQKESGTGPISFHMDKTH